MKDFLSCNNLSNIEYLNLQNPGINDTDMKHLANNAERFTSLKRVYLQYNNIITVGPVIKFINVVNMSSNSFNCIRLQNHSFNDEELLELFNALLDKIKHRTHDYRLNIIVGHFVILNVMDQQVKDKIDELEAKHVYIL
jgi:hypothetical protein